MSKFPSQLGSRSSTSAGIMGATPVLPSTRVPVQTCARSRYRTPSQVVGFGRLGLRRLEPRAVTRVSTQIADR
jgi:hypothetical protein